MRVLFITQWFDPEPAFKGAGFARGLRDHGHEVEVVTAFPNYPGGKVYPGYRIRPRKREIVDGIPVTRVAIYPSHDRNALGRILNYISFPISATIFALPALGAFDAVYVYHPPLTAALPAIVLRLFRGTPFVLDIQDLWPDTIGATGMLSNRFALAVIGGICRVVYKLAARISVPTPGFKRELVRRGVPASKVEVVYNWSEEEHVRTAAAELPEGWPDRERYFTVLFAGTMGRAQGLETVIAAARLLATRKPHVRIVFMGGGVDADALRKEAEGLTNVVFIERQPRERAAQCLHAADALLVHLRDKPLFRITIPSKVQAYLVTGRPIIAGLAGDAADLVAESGGGIVCQPGNPQSIAEAIVRLADTPKEERDAMGARAQSYYFERLPRERGIRRAAELLSAAAR